MAIVNTTRPMTSRLCLEAMGQLQNQYPFIRGERLTTTAFGRPIRTMTLGCGARKVLFTGAHHGNEGITATLLLKFTEELAQAAQTGGELYGVSAETILKACTLCLVPMVDPDGVDLVTGAVEAGTPEYAYARDLAAHYPEIPFPEGWKANLLGVDLNLQYPAGWFRARQIKFDQGYNRPGPRDYVGRGPLTQRESIALAALTEELEPELVLAYHTQGRVIYWQYQDYTVPGARALAEEFARLSGYSLEEVPTSSGFAGYKDWFIQEFRRPGFTIEAGLGENPLPPDQFDGIYRENLGILVTAALGLKTST